MAVLRVTAEHQIDAPAEQVYAYISDSQHHHAHFLPPAFTDFKVEQGGVGAGTIHSFHIAAGGRNRFYRMKVAEPVPGQVITESDLNSSLVTTFTVQPDGNRSRVKIETTWNGAKGIGGFFERLFAPKAMQRLYLDELDRLNRYAVEQAKA
ncbi:MAG: SRPBCC family protein [Herpetosiphon sp.]